MSKSKRTISSKLNYKTIRDVYLNKNGVKIGAVVELNGQRAYLSWRNEKHYFIKHRGFAVDKVLLWEMIKNDKIDTLIIEYKGVKGTRYFTTSVDDWILKSKEVGHVKDRGDVIETYGQQVVLCEDFMDEVEVK